MCGIGHSKARFFDGITMDEPTSLRLGRTCAPAAAGALLLCLALSSGSAAAQSGPAMAIADQHLNRGALASAPASWRPLRDYSLVPVPLDIRAPELAEAERSEMAPKLRGPAILGVGRPVPAIHQGELGQSLTWSRTGAGVVAAFRVTSLGAKAMRIALKGALPAGGAVRFFSLSDARERFSPYGSKDFRSHAGMRQSAPKNGQAAGAQRLLWSPSVAGEAIGVEISLPSAAAKASLSLQVVRISHLLHNPAAPPPFSAAPRPGDAEGASCSAVDVTCSTASSCDRMAAVRILFTEDDGRTYLCTATTINDQRDTRARLGSTHLLTANHCVNAQAVAETVETWWRYQSASCGSSARSSRFASLRKGADLVATHAGSDHSLLKLRESLPNLPVCWKGWSSTAAGIGDAVQAVHHPDGGLKEWAAGEIVGKGIARLGGWDGDAGKQEVAALVVEYSEGGTKPGSSGAALLSKDDGRIIGVLSGAPEGDCTRGGYGRFDRFAALPAVRAALAGQVAPDAPTKDDHGDARASATGILLGSNTRGSIDFAGDEDFFRIQVTQPGALTLWTSGNTDTAGALLLENGEVAAEDDDSGQENNFRITRQVAAGTYYARVAGYSKRTGSYLLLVELQSEEQATYAIPLFLGVVADSKRESFMRIINNSLVGGTVQIVAIDDAGEETRAVTLSLDGSRSRLFNSSDLEAGNAAKGLSAGIGDGGGPWRLELKTSLDITPLAYIRTRDGFVTNMDTLAPGDARGYDIKFFNPASNNRQRSLLRLVNPNASQVDITITGLDDDGQAGIGAVRLRLAAGAAATLSAEQLEQGDGEVGLDGRLGDGQGKWRLSVSSNMGIWVMNLLESPSGHLSNLSAVHVIKSGG